jgi:hypothetical protein
VSLFQASRIELAVSEILWLLFPSLDAKPPASSSFLSNGSVVYAKGRAFISTRLVDRRERFDVQTLLARMLEAI